MKNALCIVRVRILTGYTTYLTGLILTDLSLKQLVDQCLTTPHGVPPNGGFAVVQAVYYLVQLLKDVHDRGYSYYGSIAGLHDLYVDQDTFSSIRDPVTVLCVPDISRLSHD